MSNKEQMQQTNTNKKFFHLQCSYAQNVVGVHLIYYIVKMSTTDLQLTTKADSQCGTAGTKFQDFT